MNIFDKILPNVKKPASYTGGELNSVTKPLTENTIRFALAFPGIYEIGMSHIGMKILYHLLNDQEDIFCERVFAPYHDMEEIMVREGIKLYGLESFDSLDKFDILGFTLPYEMCYSNILNMLSLSGIPFLSKDRGDEYPLICAGGPCTYNPEPIADFIDFFIIGEGEEVILEVMDVFKKFKHNKSKFNFLQEIAKLDGVYVPSFYDVDYRDDGVYYKKNNVHAKDAIRKRIIKKLNYFPNKIIVPYVDIVHDRISLEIFRGCFHGCRFCQAGYIYRPVRFKDVKTLIKNAEELFKNTGYEEISLCSLSTGDYKYLDEIFDELIRLSKENNINISMPSLRIDSEEIIDKLNNFRKINLTFAPEAGSQRLRDVINKNITEEDILNSCKIAFANGYNSLKLYFMLGLPTETDEDIIAISELVFKILHTYSRVTGRRLNITVSTSFFIPKPFTPFQWQPQISTKEMHRRQKLLASKLKHKNIKYNWHDFDLSLIEGVFARGDRRLSKSLVKAFELGCKFDDFNEFFDFEKWKKAIPNIEYYTQRERDYSEKLPWDHINIGIKKEFFIKENEKALSNYTTPNCTKSCSGCGLFESCEFVLEDENES